jgi:hypothetical protein
MLRRLFPWLCLLAAGCTPGATTGRVTPEALSAASDVTGLAARQCPWPADVARYAQTTLTARGPREASPDLRILGATKAGCAVLTFSVDDSGVVASSDVVSEYPAGFGAVASQVLRWNDFATGGSSLTVFMVRVGVQKLSDGGAMEALGFKDTIFALMVHPTGL